MKKFVFYSVVVWVAMGGAGHGFSPNVQAADYALTNVTDMAGVADMGHQRWGGAWVDYDKDGWMDLYPVNGDGNPGDPEDENTLFRNNGDGTFTDVTSETGTGDFWIAMRNVFADYDRDGDVDLYSHNFAQSTLYQNNGNVFTDVNVSSGAGIEMPNGTAAAWVDYDNDGWLDLHATGFPNSWNVLFHNNRDGTFTDVQPSSGMNFFASAMGNAWLDYDRDGDQDVALSAVTGEDQTYFYINNGDGTFTDATAQVGIVTEEGSSGSAVYWADYDNDGWFDLLLTEVSVGSVKILPLRMYLFRNKGDGTFEDVTGPAGLLPPEGTSPSLNYSDVAFADYDNDGDQDLVVATFIGTVRGGLIFYRNNGDGTFTDISAELNVDQDVATKAVLWADYDRDGDVDFYTVQVDGFTQPNQLLQNNGGPNNWLQVELVGTCSNLDAIGSQISVVAGQTTQVRDVNGGTGLFSQHSPIQHFGLGSATAVSFLRVRWPSGKSSVLTDVSVNQRLVVVEPENCRSVGDLLVTVVPNPLTLEVPSSGGVVRGTVQIENTGNMSPRVDVWMAVLGPNNIERTRRISTVRILPAEIVEFPLVRRVGASAPPGEYTLTANVGTFDTQVLGQGSFQFVKLPVDPP